MGEYVVTVLILVSIYVVLASSLNLVLGHTGLLSLSHAAFYGIGAYVSALTALRFGWTFALSTVAGAVVAAVLAAILAVPALKMRGDNFILGSLGFQVIIHDVIYNWDAVTSGSWGLSGIPHPTLFGMTVTTNTQHLALYLPLALATVVLLHVASRAPFGKVLNAIREDELAVTALGKSVRSFRIRAFALAAAMAGVGGAMYAHYVTFIDPSSFSFVESVYIVSLVIIGGAGNTRGPLIGAAVLVVLPEVLRFVAVPLAYASNVRQIIYGLLLVVFVLLRPKGLAGEDIF
jgi:branched-chain amino acid transport system permease protein